ncbi:transcriptional regulator [Bradyrhizobium macuxiense]|uniref:Transcriptional regulator n=1 Tax=Bradyrhizobium macuxiense TaxID=1755647 RepID=A0A109K0H7_9BRAD|nr:helix-turn-helix domain-containing protein [Bradyrhizobium macuxiense]KWV58438.1 transcriptional regulator [Bradyrhizobium macuxiense]
MENNTTDVCCGGDGESCPTDPALLIEFKHAIHALGGKWKLEILFELMNGGVRFGALRRALAPVTQHMLTAQLRELERDGLVSRNVLVEKPLQVEYELTDSAWGLIPAFRELLAWSKAFGPRRNVAISGTTVGAGIA